MVQLSLIERSFFTDDCSQLQCTCCLESRVRGPHSIRCIVKVKYFYHFYCYFFVLYFVHCFLFSLFVKRIVKLCLFIQLSFLVNFLIENQKLFTISILLLSLIFLIQFIFIVDFVKYLLPKLAS